MKSFDVVSFYFFFIRFAEIITSRSHPCRKKKPKDFSLLTYFVTIALVSLHKVALDNVVENENCFKSKTKLAARRIDELILRLIVDGWLLANHIAFII